VDQVLIMKTTNGYSVEVPDINVDVKPGVYVFLTLPTMLAFLAEVYDGE